jgi:hypothetical protein
MTEEEREGSKFPTVGNWYESLGAEVWLQF